MKTIFIRNGEIKKRAVVLLSFSFDQALIDLVKTLPSWTWSNQQKAWIIPYSEEVVSQLLPVFQGKAWLDYSEFKKMNMLESAPASLPAIDPALQLEIEKFQDWMRNRRYSESTIKNYVLGLDLFLRFTGNKNLAEITNADLESFHKDYIISRKYSASFQSLVINAVKLYFTNRLKRKLDPIAIERPKNPKLLPHVLSKEQVKAILEAHQNMKHGAMLSLIYACGLRRSELLNLKLQDIDSTRGMLRVNQGKGKKDRLVPISEKLVKLLREYYQYEKPKEYLFEGTVVGKTYSPTSLQEVSKSAVKKAGINNAVTLHWLRHSYATHLLENRTDLRFIQELLGHNSSKTTEIYTHVSQKSLQKIRNPFDDL
ncbi:tyrosine-type recombinase/integrase [Algoriphagus namhaensis]